MSRLDVALVERGLAASRTLAARLIAEGAVRVCGTVVKKASASVAPTDEITLAQSDVLRFVSRGGLKLAAALDAFSVSAAGKCAFDFGASTGGFTDCLLSRGACHVYAVDVGRAQLHASLRDDCRVTLLEQCDCRTLTEREIPAPLPLGVMDVSFISQGLLYEACARFLTEGADLITLYKPQFEVGRAHVGKGGLVRSARAVEEARDALLLRAEACGLACSGQIESPILGGDGNREYLLHFRRRRYV